MFNRARQKIEALVEKRLQPLFERRIRPLLDRHLWPRLEGRFDPAGAVRLFEEKLYEPRAAVDAAMIRIIIFGIFVYKMLSVDFSNCAFAPEGVFDIYPARTFSPSIGYYFFGGRPIVDLVTFHWIHWFLPYPSETLLTNIQWTAIGLCTAVIFFGRGYKNLLAIAAFSVVSYLWGYIWATAGGEDAVFLPLGMMLFYCFSTHREALVLSPRAAPLLEYTRESGWFFSMCILIFVNYYFLSGINKLVHISLWSWVSFDGMESAILYLKAEELGFFKATAPGAVYMQYIHWIDILAVPFTYLSHLLIPIIFYRRDMIFRFWIFYSVFHYMAWMMNILFLSNFIAWFCLFPVSRLVERFSKKEEIKTA